MRTVGLVTAGLLAGGALGLTGIASAAGTPTPSPSAPQVTVPDCDDVALTTLRAEANALDIATRLGWDGVRLGRAGRALDHPDKFMAERALKASVAAHDLDVLHEVGTAALDPLRVLLLEGRVETHHVAQMDELRLVRRHGGAGEELQVVHRRGEPEPLLARRRIPAADEVLPALVVVERDVQRPQQAGPAVVVLQQGRLCHAWAAEGRPSGVPQLLMSATKSVIGLLWAVHDVRKRTRADAAPWPPLTARNALVIATEILLASNFETAPLRRITCIGGCAPGAASDSGGT